MKTVCSAAGGIVCLLLFAGCLRSDNAGERQLEAEASGGAKVSAVPQKIDPSIMVNRTFNEAPMLEEKVRSGELPPVSERLPEKPLVMVPVDEIGKYGGAIRRAMNTDVIQESAIAKTLSESLMAFERPLPNSLQLNMAESYEFLDEGRILIIKLRKGIKWSDGVPFTVEDILFWYEDMTLDEDARLASNNPLFPSRWLNDGKPVKMELADEITLKISSEQPMGRILETLCHSKIAFPKHILARYHPKYNPDADYDDFRKKTTDGMLAFQPGIPRLSAWVPVQWERSQKAIYERNPYYWKIDTLGNQLPYADTLEFTIIPNNELVLLKFTNGELDLFGRSFNENMYSFLKEREKGSGYKIHLPTYTPGITLYPNWDAPNPALRQAFRNKSVRIALSHAINREEISQLVYNGLVNPGGLSFSHASPYYSEKMAQLYSQYDPEKSRNLLDKAEFIDSNGDGYRELNDGSIFEVTLDTMNFSVLPDFSELLAEYWEAIGIKVNLNIALQEIILPRRINGNFEITITSMPVHPLNQSHMLAPVGPNLPFWHRNADKEGPPWLRQATDAIIQAQITRDSEKRGEYMVRIRDLYSENIPMISIGSESKPWGSSKRLGNVPDKVNVEDLYRGWERVSMPEQMFIKY